MREDDSTTAFYLEALKVGWDWESEDDDDTEKVKLEWGGITGREYPTLQEAIEAAELYRMVFKKVRVRQISVSTEYVWEN